MKQYLNLEQSNKLIELGYTLPKSISKLYYDDEGRVEDIEYSYSIGELLSFLPIISIDHKATGYIIFVCYSNSLELITDIELIDALFVACVKLKNKK